MPPSSWQVDLVRIDLDLVRIVDLVRIDLMKGSHGSEAKARQELVSRNRGKEV